MPKYRKKPIVFEAFQMTAELYWEGSEWPGWLLHARAMAAGTEGSVSQRGEDLVIHTLKGSMVIGDDDYIIQGAEGEIYPCKPDLFEATYEAVEGDG